LGEYPLTIIGLMNYLRRKGPRKTKNSRQTGLKKKREKKKIKGTPKKLIHIGLRDLIKSERAKKKGITIMGEKSKEIKEILNAPIL